MKDKYIIKIGDYYYHGEQVSLSFFDVTMTANVLKSKIFVDEDVAKAKAKKYNGTVLKLNIELEKV